MTEALRFRLGYFLLAVLAALPVSVWLLASGPESTAAGALLVAGPLVVLGLAQRCFRADSLEPDEWVEEIEYEDVEED